MHINFKKGKQKLNGADAVRYLRIRKIYEDQDIDRIQVQQRFVMQLFEKMKRPMMILKIPELINIALDNIETNLSYGQIAYLAKMGLDMERESIQTDTLVGENRRIGKLDYYIVDEASAREQVRRFAQGKSGYYDEIQKQKKENEREKEDTAVAETTNE